MSEQRRSGQRLLPGRVVRLRLRPEDCLTAVDVVEKLGLLVPGMSFDRVVSTALAAAFEGLRRSGAVPRRQGFEFTERMQRFPSAREARRRAIEVNKLFDQPNLAVPPIGHAGDDVQERFEELCMLREQRPLEEAEEREFRELVARLFEGSPSSRTE